MSPRAFASLDSATMHPSLFERTMTGRPTSSGLRTRSHDTKKLLQSTRAYMAGCVSVFHYKNIDFSIDFKNIFVGGNGNTLSVSD